MQNNTILKLKNMAKSSTNGFKKLITNKKYQKSVLIDTIAIAIFIIVALSYNFIITDSFEDFTTIYDSNPVSEILQTAEGSELDDLRLDLRSLVMKTIFSTLALIILFILTIAYSRKIQWDYLTKDHIINKSWKKWPFFIILQTLIIILITFPLIFIKTLIVWIIQQIFNLPMASLPFQLIDKILLLIVFFTIFHIILISNYIFHKQNLIWKTIGDSYHTIISSISTIKTTIKAIMIYLILNLVVVALIYNNLTDNQIIKVIIQIIIFTTVFSYLRLKIYTQIKSKHQKSKHQNLEKHTL